MKGQTVSPTVYYACKVPGGHKLPNAAQRRYYAEKLTDTLLAAAITIAIVVIGIVLITM